MPYPSSRKDAAARYNDFARHEQGGHDRVRRWSNEHLTWLREAHSRYPDNGTKGKCACDDRCGPAAICSGMELQANQLDQWSKR
jgi:hypothetical protein